MIYRVAIIGLGNIGMLYDWQLPWERYVLSHARAFSLHPDFDLVGAVEPEAKLRSDFVQVYKARAYADIEEMMFQTTPDVIVVASPTPTHGQVINEILLHCQPRAILCEKPLAYDSDTARTIVEACQLKQVHLYVNYIRRADPGIQEVKARLDSGQIAVPCKAVVWYSKGLLHNGSHFADLLTYWFGEIRDIRAIAPGRIWGAHDAEPDLLVLFEQCTAVFCAAQEENYSYYTVEVVAANGRLRYEQDGIISWQAAVPHITLPGYRQLKPDLEIIDNDMNRYQYRVCDQLSKALSGADHTLSTGVCAMSTGHWLEKAIHEQPNDNER